jgi:hypothetical protein
MKRRLAKLLGKKETVRVTPFALTILVDPATGRANWNMVNLGPVPYQFIYGALDQCRDHFKVEEMNARARAQVKEEAQKMDAEEKLSKPQAVKDGGKS